MKILFKSIIFTLIFMIWTLVFGILCSPTLLLKRGHKVILKVGTTWAKVSLWLLKTICNISNEIIGIENIPSGPFIIASKHQSAWETIFFLYFFKNPVLIIKKELTYIPIYGWYLNKMSMIIIDRNNGMKSIKQIKNGVREALMQERSIIIFPEGTRTKPGMKVSYKSGIKLLYDTFRYELPVIPISLNTGMYWINKSIIKRPGMITVKIYESLPQNIENDFLKYLQEIIN